MSGTLKIGGKTLATHDTSSNKLAFHSDANDTGQLCRAWVNFNGTLAMTVGSSYGPDAPPADYSSPNPIRAAYNVDYIIDRGTGDYEIHFENAMPDANYCALIIAEDPPSGTNIMSVGQVVSKGLNSVRFETQASHNYVNYDLPNCNVAIFR